LSATAIAEARPIPLEAPVIMTCLPTSGPVRVVAAGPVRVEVLGPVAPQRRGVVGEVRDVDTGAAQRFCGVVGGEHRVQVDDVEDLGGYAELGDRHVAQHLGAAAGV
jgi:hypothetical protein